MSVLQSPGVPNSLVAGKNAGNFGNCAIEQGIFCACRELFRVLDRSREFGQNRSALWRSTETYHPREHEEGRHDLLASDPRAARTASPLTSQPHRIPTGWIPEDGRGRVRKRRGGESRSFILARRAGGRPGRSWCRAPATDHPHPRGDPRRSRLGRRRGSLCLLRAPGRSQRRPCGRSSP